MFFQAGRTTLRSSSSDDADQHGGQARALNTLLPALDARHSLDCDHFLSTGPSVFDRVLESTSTKEKMAKYQAAVFKQSGAQPVSSHRTVHIDTGASRTMRPYLCVQPAKFLSSVSLPPSLSVCCPAGCNSRGTGSQNISASRSETHPCASVQR